MPNDTIDDKIQALATRNGDINRKLISGLEVVDSTVVHTFGDETINGIKKFGDKTFMLLDVTKGTIPSSNTWCGNYIVDSTATFDNWGVAKRFAWIDYAISPDGSCNYTMVCCKNEANSVLRTGLSLGFDTNGIAYTTCCSTDTNRSNDTDIVTRDFIPKDTRIVHTSGDEIINGTKTFATNVRFNETTYSVLKAVRGSDISEDITKAYMFRATTGTAGRNIISGMTFKVDTNKQTSITISCGSWTVEGSDQPNASLVLTNTPTGERQSAITSKFIPYTSNVYTLGNANHLWSQLYAGTATIATSDERIKQNIIDIPDNVLDAWEDVHWSQFRFKDAVKEKNNYARFHNGLIAQRILEAFNKHNLDASHYGLLCHDSWDAIPEEKDSETGEVTQEARPAGDLYSLRYEECLAVEAAYQRRKVARLESVVQNLIARIEKLEKK